MANWKSMLRADPTDWLLEPDNPSVRYWTLTDILDRPPGDPCPLANLLALKALAQVPEMRDSQAAHIGAEMVETITTQADEKGRYTAASIYHAWKGWSFADKKNPSPWLTFLVLRVIKRICM